MNAILDEQPRARQVDLPSRGGQMAALEFGPADRPVDIVFTHANGFNGRTYRTILAPIAKSLRILAVDMRGHGGTTLPADPTTWEGWNGFRDDLLAFLDAAVTGPVVLGGHSMGGTTSLLASAAAPDRVKALALFDPVLFDSARAEQDATGPNPLADGAERRRAVFPSKAAVREAYTGRGAFRTWTADQLADYVEAGFRETEDGQVTLACAPAWEASSFRIHRYDAWAAFRAVQCPIRMLRAEIGSTARVTDNLEELEANPRLSMEVIPGTSHFLPMERPDLVAAVLTELAGA